MYRNDFSKEEAQNRINSQMPLDKKCQMSHFVIDNSGSISTTEEAALRIFKMMQTSNHHWINRLKILLLISLIAGLIYFLDKYLNFLPNMLKFQPK